MLEMVRSVQILEVKEESVSANCAPVDDAAVSDHCGVEVPTPSAVRAESKKNDETPLSDVPLANCTAPVPPTADEPLPELVMHVPFTAKQPLVRFKPPDVPTSVEVAVVKFATPAMAKREPGDEVAPTPTLPV